MTSPRMNLLVAALLSQEIKDRVSYTRGMMVLLVSGEKIRSSCQYYNWDLDWDLGLKFVIHTRTYVDMYIHTHTYTHSLQETSLSGRT